MLFSHVSRRVRGFVLAGAVALGSLGSVLVTAAQAEPVAAGRFNDPIEDLAKAPGNSAAQRKARQDVATVYYATAGMMDRFAGDLKGIDLSKPVALTTVTDGVVMYQFIRQGATYLGNFFSPRVDVQPTCLGISGSGRVEVAATMPPANALRSVAAPIVDSWTTKGVDVPTEGGCDQVVVDNTTRQTATITGPVALGQ